MTFNDRKYCVQKMELTIKNGKWILNIILKIIYWDKPKWNIWNSVQHIMAPDT